MITAPLMAGLFTLCAIQMVPLFKYDVVSQPASKLFLPLFFAWCISSPIIAVLISLYTGRVASTLTFTTEGLSEIRRYLFGIIRIRHSFVWSDFTSWFRRRASDDEGEKKVRITYRIDLYTKSKRNIWFNHNQATRFKIDDTVATWKNGEVADTVWKEMTEKIGVILDANLPREMPAWYEKRENARAPWIFGFFITAIVVMVLVFLSPIFVAIFAMLRSIIR
jgi:hypothetical protein